MWNQTTSATSLVKVVPVGSKSSLYVVDWWDHCSSSGSWSSLEQVKAMAPVLIRSVGFIVAETKDTITLVAHSDSIGHNVAGDICILKACIKRKKLISNG